MPMSSMVLAGLAITAGLLHVQAQCVETQCKSKLDMLACDAGFDVTAEEDCGDETCVPFLGCSYAKAKKLCCPSNCHWSDLSCNKGILEGYFVHLSNYSEARWTLLPDSLREKLTTAEKFANFTVNELKDVGVDILVEAKAVAGMTAVQLQGMSDEIRGINTSQLQSFLQNLSPSSLAEAMPFLVGDCEDESIAEKLELYSTVLQRESAWGQFDDWSAANLSALQCMIGVMPTTNLLKMADEALAQSGNLVDLSSQQLKELSSKFGSMSVTNLEQTLQNINFTRLQESLLFQASFCRGRIAADTLLTQSQHAAEAFAESICGRRAVTAAESEVEAIEAACGEELPAEMKAVQWGKQQARALMEHAANQVSPLNEWSSEIITVMSIFLPELEPDNITLLNSSALILGDYLNYDLAGKVGAMDPAVRDAYTAKLKEAVGNTNGWSCEQIASAKELVAGLNVSDIAQLAVSEIRGLLPSAVTAMTPLQTAALTAEHFKVLSEEARARVTGLKLAPLMESGNLEQLVAAVCGNLTVGEAGCPPRLVDVVMAFPHQNWNPTQQVLFQNYFSELDTIGVRTMSVLAADELPTAARRLAGGSSWVTLRVELASDSLTTAAEVREEAEQGAGAEGGSVIEIQSAELSRRHLEKDTMSAAVSLRASSLVVILFMACMTLM